MLMETAIKNIKDELIFMIRQYFRNPKNYKLKMPPELDPLAFTDMAIYDAEPEELRKFPTIIITSGSGNIIPGGLGGDFCAEIKDPRTGTIIAYRYQGFYELNFSIDLGCKTPFEREVLCDFLVKALRFDLRRFIQADGILIKNVSYGGENVVEYNSDKIYTAQVRVDTFSSWIEDRELLDPNEFNIRMQGKFKLDDKSFNVVENAGTIESDASRYGETISQTTEKRVVDGPASSNMGQQPSTEAEWVRGQETLADIHNSQNNHNN